MVEAETSELIDFSVREAQFEFIGEVVGDAFQVGGEIIEEQQIDVFVEIWKFKFLHVFVGLHKHQILYY